MFTGIISEIGVIKSIKRDRDSYRFEISAPDTGEGLKTGDSVAVNGVCLSITRKNGNLFFDVVNNTIKTTDLKRLKAGDKVNLESALRMGDTLSGHIVSGHVDGERRIRKNRKTRDGWVLEIETLSGDRVYLVPKGSITVDGVSLTIGELAASSLRVFIIPHTLDNTTLQYKKAGDHVNIEFDCMGKYAAKSLQASKINENTLREKGFI
ncbi:MAG: riboflavin synthase [Candidatus Omnitrophota bacterium]